MLRMDTPALEKGGYTLGLAPIAFQYKGSARVLVIRPFDGSAEKRDPLPWTKAQAGTIPFHDSTVIYAQGLCPRAVYPPFSRAGDRCACAMVVG